METRRRGGGPESGCPHLGCEEDRGTENSVPVSKTASVPEAEDIDRQLLMRHDETGQDKQEERAEEKGAGERVEFSARHQNTPEPSRCLLTTVSLYPSP